MRDFLIVLGYTFHENIRKKAFIVSTIVALILTIAIILVPAGIKLFEQNKSISGTEANEKVTKTVVYFVDSKGLFKNDLSKLTEIFSDYDFKVEPSDKIKDLQKQVKDGKKESLIVIDEKEGVPYFDYYVKQYGSGLNPSDLSREMKILFDTALLKEANVSEGTIKSLFTDVTYSVEELGKSMAKGYVACFIIMMLLFFSVYYYGYGVSMSVASEKTSRVMEILLTSTKPSKIILGKSAAMGLVGLLQLTLIILVGAVTYKIFFPKDFSVFGQSIDLTSLTPFVIFMVFTYFILGYTLYAMMNAVVGATVSKAEDINSAIMPISFVSILSFYLAYGTIFVPNGAVAVIASIFPFSAAFSMPCRLIIADVPAWQVMASLFAMIITIVFMSWISIKIYSSAVLHYGRRLKTKDLIRMSKKQSIKKHL